MMFREKLNTELEQKSDEFRAYAREQSADLTSYLQVLSEIEKTPFENIIARLGGQENVGAIPAQEMAANGSFRFQFASQWENHEQARAWAIGVLKGRTTFAADGSQIYAGKETSLPVAAIQIGCFENPHNEAAAYEKNAGFEILTPADLLKDQDEPMNPDIRVEERRYLGEAAKVDEFLGKKHGWRARGERMPMAFFDNPLLVPFSQKGLQKSFLEATVNLVQRSRETEVPLVGYVDRSFSRDILTMLDHFGGKGNASETSLFDAYVLHGRREDGTRLLDSWGDRTCFFYSNRRGLSALVDTATGRSTVGFIYLKTTSDSAPSRIDIPGWIYEAGHLEEIIDVIRAECIVGLGYPYALETADQTAVITRRDREIFFRALQEFAVRERLDFSVSRKDSSKGRRR